MSTRLVLALIAGTALFAQEPAKDAAAAPKAPATDTRPDRLGELERLGENGRELMILGIDAPGFDKLKRTQRLYAYYLYRAAIAGNDIMYLQSHRFAWDIKELFETLYEHRTKLDPAAAAGIEEYLKLVWANHGQYLHWQHTKFVPRNLTFKQLQQAVKAAKKDGAKFQTRKGEGLEQALLRLKPHIFDPKTEPLQVNQAPGADVIATSANGFYDPGVKLADIQAFPKEIQEKLNVRFALKRDKRGHRVVEPETFMIGGVYGEQLANVAFWLKRALQYVDLEQVKVEKDGVMKTRMAPVASQKKALEDLLAFFETGDEAKFKEHTIAWLKTRSAVDYLNGFHEVYKDPRSVIGSYEANVSFRADSDKIEKLSQSAMYFEAKMPWKDAWKRAKVDPPVASVVNVLVETGDGGPMSAAAYNLPNYEDVRRQHGSKNVVLLNVETARSPQLTAATNQAFYLPADQELIARYATLGRQWLVYMHEVIGHGSGQADEALKGADPAVLIGGTYSALEECRADCVALYQFFDPKVVEIGAVGPEEQENAAKAMYLQTLTRQIMANGMTEGEVIREAHERGSQLVLNYLTQPGKDFGVQIVQKDGHFFVDVTDVKKAREGVGEILVKLQTLKSLGDKAGADAFFDQFGTRINRDWQKDAKTRLEAIGRPKETAFVFPQLVPVVEDKGERVVLKDVALECKETFAEQMMRFRAWSRSREIAPK